MKDSDREFMRKLDSYFTDDWDEGEHELSYLWESSGDDEDVVKSLPKPGVSQ